MILPKTKIAPINDWLTRAESALLPYLITQPPLGWDQTPTGLVPPANRGSEYVFPFQFTRGAEGGTNGLWIRYGTVTPIGTAAVVPDLDGAALSLTLTDNFLATWSDPETTDTGTVYFEITTDDSDEWTFTLTSIEIKWDANLVLPADTGAGTATCVKRIAIGTDHPDGFVNTYYSNLGLVRFGQAGEDYYLFGT